MKQTLTEKLGRKVKSAAHSFREYVKYSLMGVCDRRFERDAEKLRKYKGNFEQGRY